MIIYLQNMGNLSTYSSHSQIGMFCIAALLVGGASVDRASIGNVFLGVILFHTIDRAHEIDLDYGSRPHQFIDLETGQQVRLRPSEVAEVYRKEMSARHEMLHQRALQYHIDYVPIDIAGGFHQLILPFLLKRSKL